MDLAYDGSGFRGFALQREVRTVQGVVEAALARLFGGPVATTGAGRTDAGVHADAQVLSCDVPADARILGDPERARRALDQLCGPEITVWAVRVVDGDFDARFSARSRRYVYRLCDAPAMSPRWRHTTWHAGPPELDVAAMAAGGAALVGEHDFSSFCRRPGEAHLVRRVLRLEVRRVAAAPGTPGSGLVLVEIDGRAFCHQMVRSIVGLLVPVGRGRRPSDDVAAVLAAGDRALAGVVAPPHGLTLVGVDY